ncbi:palmitoyltransferase swf1 [Coemansia sp. RSA 552]|nr:palmitoyltransferase swf1 [Coemansia sp. RSA 552]
MSATDATKKAKAPPKAKAIVDDKDIRRSGRERTAPVLFQPEVITRPATSTKRKRAAPKEEGKPAAKKAKTTSKAEKKPVKKPTLWGFILFWVLASVLALGAAVFVLILGPNRMFQGSPIARAYTYLTETAPEALERWAAGSRAGGRLTALAERVWSVLFWRRNPVFQIFGVVLYWIGLAVFFLQAAPWIPNRYVGAWHWIPITATLAVNVFCFVASCVADPGIVTAENVDMACELFPYDQLLFFAKDCRTCNHRRPARSKHCSACGHCVQMMDHHCIWLNNCVGLHNARWFLGFLATFCIVCMYGAFLLGTVVLELRHASGLGDGLVVDEWGNTIQLSFKSSILYMLDQNAGLTVLLVLLLVLAPAIAVFAAYQLRITLLGYTSNEEAKWLNVANAVEDGVVFAVRQSEHAAAEVFQVIEKEDQAHDTRPRRPISHLRQVPNRYSHGPWANLKLILSPPKAQKPHLS